MEKRNLGPRSKATREKMGREDTFGVDQTKSKEPSPKSGKASSTTGKMTND